MSILTIWKFPLAITDQQEVRMPLGAVPLSVAMQGDVLCLWCAVAPDAEQVNRLVFVHGTGHPMDARAEVYVGIDARSAPCVACVSRRRTGNLTAGE